MKKIMNITLFLLLTMTMSMQAQLTHGTMTMELTEASSDNPQIAAMTDMMKGMTTVITFKDKMSVTTVDAMGGMVKSRIKVDEEENFDMLMDMMGQKFWVSATKLEQDKRKAESDDPMEYMEISYDKEDTKTIAGYDCYKMKAVFPDMEGAVLEAYVTEELDIPAPVIQGVDIKKFEGFPLEYQFNNGSMVLTFTTKSLVDTVDETVLNFDTSGYQKMTMDEFLQMTGGMGMGF